MEPRALRVVTPVTAVTGVPPVRPAPVPVAPMVLVETVATRVWPVSAAPVVSASPEPTVKLPARTGKRAVTVAPVVLAAPVVRAVRV